MPISEIVTLFFNHIETRILIKKYSEPLSHYTNTNKNYEKKESYLCL